MGDKWFRRVVGYAIDAIKKIPLLHLHNDAGDMCLDVALCLLVLNVSDLLSRPLPGGLSSNYIKSLRPTQKEETKPERERLRNQNKSR